MGGWEGVSRQVGTGGWVGSCAGGGLWVISVPDWWPPAVLHPPPPSPACGQVRAAVALDDVTAKAVQAVHAHLHMSGQVGMGQGAALQGGGGSSKTAIQAVHAHHQLRSGEWAGVQQCSIISCPGRMHNALTTSCGQPNAFVVLYVTSSGKFHTNSWS